MFRIGDFSRLSQVSVKALRFYDEIGLLKPTFVDSTTGYRYYAANLLPRLNRILALKELGFSLEEIRYLFSNNLSVDRVQELLENKQTEIARRIEQEQSRLAQVESWLTQIEQQGSVPDFQVTLKRVAPQLVASVQDSLAAYSDAGALFNEIRSHLRKYDVASQHGAIWHSCTHTQQHINCEAVVFLREPSPGNERVKVYELPETLMASVIHQGNEETCEQAYRAIRCWIKSQGYKIAGPNRELYWQGSIEQDDDSSITEIQFPIKNIEPLPQEKEKRR
ncbi:MAG: GyrI-like domain-containing protein [Acidobacteriota bacterium]